MIWDAFFALAPLSLPPYFSLALHFSPRALLYLGFWGLKNGIEADLMRNCSAPFGVIGETLSGSMWFLFLPILQDAIGPT